MNLEAKLKDPSLDFLAALKEYSTFAQEYDCPTSCKDLTWVRFLNGGKSLQDGTVVRFHGLNSALLSDASDTKANLLLGEFQFRHFGADARYVDVVLCHHPHSWLIDGNRANDRFRTQAHVVLSGHEHDARYYIEGGSLRVFAGATHPSRCEGPWEPCYHVLRLSVDTTVSRELIVGVETRVWREKDQCFCHENRGDSAVSHEERLPLKAWVRPVAGTGLLSSTNPLTPVSSTEVMNVTTMTPDVFAASRRKLIVHFFRVGLLPRFKATIKAGVWEEGDDAFDGQERWARVFERAEKNGKLELLWDAVAQEDKTLAGQINPFTKKT